MLCSVDEVNDADNEGGWASLEGEKFARKEFSHRLRFFFKGQQ